MGECYTKSLNRLRARAAPTLHVHAVRMTDCHLHIAGFSDDAADVERQFGVAAAPLPRLLARADRAPLPALNNQALALHGVLSERASGVAPVMLAGEDGAFDHAGVWMCATPAHLRIEQDRLVLVDARQLALGRDEAEALLTTLNAHFADDGIAFVAPSPDRWYARLHHAPAMTTTPLDDVIGRDIHPHLPKGADALLWHRRYNEVQMLLHAHPVNAAREARGLPVVNSLWWWGEGSAAPVQRRFASISADDVLVRGLARLSATPLRSLPADAAAWLAALEPAGEHYLYLDALALAWAYRDFGAWNAARAHLEHTWLDPLFAALKDKRITRLTIDALTPARGTRMTLSRLQLWRFWRDWQRA